MNSVRTDADTLVTINVTLSAAQQMFLESIGREMNTQAEDLLVALAMDRTRFSNGTGEVVLEFESLLWRHVGRREVPQMDLACARAFPKADVRGVVEQFESRRLHSEKED